MPGGFLPPPSVIASWPKPNYDNPPTKGYALLICLCVFLVLALLALAARIWARFVLLRQAGLDDLLASLAAIPTIGLTIAIALATQKYQFDRHVWDVEPSMRAPMSRNSWVTQLFFVISTCTIKVSILLFNRRLSAGTHSRIFSGVVWAAIAAIVAYGLAFILILIFQCQPLESYWMRFSPTYNGVYNCHSKEAESLPISAYLSTATDFLALLLPFWLVWNLRLPRRQKISLYIIFGLGLIVVMAGVFRCVYLYRMFNDTYDVTWVGNTQWIWTCIENDLALIAACGPALRPFLIRYLPDSITPPNEVYPTAPTRRKTRVRTSHLIIPDVEDGPTLPIQSPAEQELATMESRIGSLMNTSKASTRRGSAIERFEGFDDGSRTFISSETASSYGKEWPLPTKSF